MHAGEQQRRAARTGLSAADLLHHRREVLMGEVLMMSLRFWRNFVPCTARRLTITMDGEHYICFRQVLASQGCWLRGRPGGR